MRPIVSFQELIRFQRFVRDTQKEKRKKDNTGNPLETYFEAKEVACLVLSTRSPAEGKALALEEHSQPADTTRRCRIARLFQVTWDDLGMQRRHELKPGGASIPVTSTNREEYVELYARFLVVESVARQFEKFKQGFMRVMGGAPSMSLLR